MSKSWSKRIEISNYYTIRLDEFEGEFSGQFHPEFAGQLETEFDGQFRRNVQIHDVDIKIMGRMKIGDTFENPVTLQPVGGPVKASLWQRLKYLN